MTQTSPFESSCNGAGCGKENQQRPQKPLSQTGLWQYWEGVWDRGGLWGGIISLKCAGGVMDAPGKWGTPPFAQVASRYPMAPAASEVLSFVKTSFWLCENILLAVPKYPFGCAGSALFLICSICNGSRQPSAVPPPLPSNLLRCSTP